MAEQAEKNGLEIGDLCTRIAELERRVTALERETMQDWPADSPCRSKDPALLGPHGEPQDAGPKPGATGDSIEKILGVTPKDTPEEMLRGVSVVPVLGKAVLAIAGAYLLRAVAESGAVPRWMMLVAGMVYACVWLVWAARSHRTNGFASGVYALTAAAILAPLLWEGTVRFGVFTPGTAALALVGFVGLSLGVSWKERLETIPWVAMVIGVGTAAALLVETHELRVLTGGILTMALVADVTSWSGRWTGLRALPGAGAIFAVGVMGMVITSGEGVAASYRTMSAGEATAICVGMVVVFGLGLVVRGFGLKMRWTVVEIALAVVAVGLGTWVSLRATQGGAAGFWGVVFLGMAGVCYWGALKRFGVKNEIRNSKLEIRDSATDTKWNRRVSANFAAALMLAGSYLLLRGNGQAVLLSAAAVCAVLVFRRTGYLSLGMHGSFYLLAAGAVCGFFVYAGQALAGTVPAWPGWSFWMVAAAGLASYLVGSRSSGKEWNARALWMVPAAVVGFAVAAAVVAGIAGMGAGELSASRLAMVRTVVTCVAALGLAYAGSRWKRAELGWVAYGAIGLGALKLVLEDLRFGNAGTLMVSLLVYGAILVLLPRVMRDKAAV